MTPPGPLDMGHRLQPYNVRTRHLFDSPAPDAADETHTHTNTQAITHETKKGSVLSWLD